MDLFDIEVDFEFQAARRLTRLPDGHPCARLHGHTFRCTARLTGPLDPARDWVADFGDVERHIETVRNELEHRYLNDLPGLTNPTSEVIAKFIWERLALQMSSLSAIVVSESSRTRCIYRGPENESRGRVG